MAYVLLCMELFFIVLAFFWRFRCFVVLSGSMEPTLSVGSIILTDTVGKKPKEGDMITFQTGERTVTHRIVQESGKGYVTKGDANKQPDPEILEQKNIIGIVSFCIPGLGYVVVWLQKYRGLFVCTGVTVLLPVILWPGKHSKKVRKQLKKSVNERRNV